MKIVFLSRYQNKVERGAEVFVSELSARLAKNHQVEVLYGDKSDSLKAIFHINPDIVIPLNGRMQSFKVSLGRLIKNYKVLISGHSGIGRDDLWNIMITRPDVFIALTSVMANWAKKYAWGSKVIKIPDGVDLKKFTPEGEKLGINLPGPLILSVGALSWYKHHERVIDAVSKLNEGSLLIVGDGEQKDHLENSGNKKLGDRFKIIKLRNEQMPQAYRTADIFTLPSWGREAFGMVYIEAMACNLPVVAPNDLSRKEIIEDAGIFVNVENVDEYAEGIKNALNTKWDQKPRKQAEKFSWEKIAKDYEEVFINMLK